MDIHKNSQIVSGVIIGILFVLMFAAIQFFIAWIVDLSQSQMWIVKTAGWIISFVNAIVIFGVFVLALRALTKKPKLSVLLVNLILLVGNIVIVWFVWFLKV